MTHVSGTPGADAGARLLFVEDDEVIRSSLGQALERYGFTVHTADDGLSALELFREVRPDLLLVDVMLPGLDGIGLCRRLREQSLTPILMLSARGDPFDVVSGLEAGADDYVTKPCESSVIVARIRSLLRRAHYPPPHAAEPQATPTHSTYTYSTSTPSAPLSPAESEDADPDLLTFGDLTVDTRGMEVRKAGRTVDLTPTELRLLLEFAASPGAVLERQTLLRRVWDYAWEGDSRVVDIHVQRLRAKIGSERIETVRGFGYKLRRC
ncbi:response regulator transcription factor [Streptomyces sp. ODS28]|uniref:response regulator transcription factor n=1 Tax=Streptomyces sp. ODS28 TaxID=3136688 RepID=UPI0031E635A3